MPNFRKTWIILLRISQKIPCSCACRVIINDWPMDGTRRPGAAIGIRPDSVFAGSTIYRHIEWGNEVLLRTEFARKLWGDKPLLFAFR